ncbi:MAG: hypothetical protein NC418_08465 [Muribaculaceae bacterium]|nr:hypothetical protein [Muribaculaceae bacterium]
MNEPTLRYTDERDKTYGIAGMTITLVACDGMEFLSEIRLDAEPGESMVMTHDYGFKGNPRMSAKIVWSQTLRQLRTTAYMALGNIACRRYVLSHRTLADSDTAPIREALRGEASDHCSLEADEADRLFDSCMAQVDRIFRHATVHEAAHSFANQLASRRTISADEAVEILARLGIR